MKMFQSVFGGGNIFSEFIFPSNGTGGPDVSFFFD